jgi:hypothetical protein
VMFKKGYFLLLISYLLFFHSQSLCAQSGDTDGLIGRGSSIGEAASTATSTIASIINLAGVARQVQRSLNAQNKTIKNVLNNSGQPGVLVYVKIEKISAETDFYNLVGGEVEYVGAGTTPEDVFFASSQNPRLEPGISPHASLDSENSCFLWFKKETGGVSATYRKAEPILREVRRRLSDDKALASLKQNSKAKALQTAVEYLERNARSNEVKRRLRELISELEEDRKKLKSIQETLASALERSRKGAELSNQISTMATVLTLAAEIAYAAGYLGNDAPIELKSAKTTSDLEKIVAKFTKDANDNVVSARAIYKTVTDQSNGIQIEQLNIIRINHYPMLEVPQLQN